MDKVLHRREIEEFLPHRDEMLLIDEAFLDDNGIAHTKYHVRGDEFFLHGHFPGNPIVPGVILCEMMAQSCGIIVKEEIPGNITLYAGLKDARFKSIVRPGDTCEILASLENRNGNLFFCSATLSVDGNLCCKAKPILALAPKCTV